MGRFGRPYLPDTARRNYGFDVQSGSISYINIFQNEDQTVLNYELSIVTNDEKIRALRNTGVKKMRHVFSSDLLSPERLRHAEEHLVFRPIAVTKRPNS